MSKKIVLPDLDPRDYQLPFFEAMDSGIKRAVLVWHRRAGKEMACWNYMIREAVCERVGTYCYFFPTSRLGRRILWDGANKDGRRFIDYIPKELIVGKPNSVEMKIELVNGSVIQIMGTDTILNVGINPVGCVFSEYSLQDPKSFIFVRPILRENGGWAVFNFTPRGKNHAYDLFIMAQENPEWFCQKLTILDTGVLTEEDMDVERKEGMSENMIQQEYFCNFNQGVEGAFYAKYLNQADIEGRITNVPYDPYALVDTYWDLGVSDSTAIIFAQKAGQEIHVIDIYTNQGEGLDHYARVLDQKAKDGLWKYGNHYAPHDIKVRELGHGAKTRLQMANDLGINFNIVPNLSIHEGIEMARGMWPKLWIDKNNCNYLIKCLENYHRVYNEKLDVYSDKPCHDWSSHFCFTGETLVTTSNGKVPIKDLQVGDYVLTPNGYKNILNVFSKVATQLVEIETDLGNFKCTADHKVFTKRGLVSADALQYNDIVFSDSYASRKLCQIKYMYLSMVTGTKGYKKTIWSAKMATKSFTWGICIGIIKNILDVPNQLKTHTRVCIERFMNRTMEKLQKAITSIIKMETIEIMPLKILNPFQVENTCLDICYPQSAERYLDKISKKHHSTQRFGMPAKREENGIGNMVLIHGKKDLEKKFQKPVCGVQKNTKRIGNILNTVPEGAKQKPDMQVEKMMSNVLAQFVKLLSKLTDMLRRKRVRKVVPLKLQKELVYDIEVKDDNCYYANGILVSNCDAFRYMGVMQNKGSQDSMTEKEAQELERLYAKRY